MAPGSFRRLGYELVGRVHDHGPCNFWGLSAKFSACSFSYSRSALVGKPYFHTVLHFQLKIRVQNVYRHALQY